MHGQPGKRAGRNEQLQKADIQEDYTYVIGTADEKRPFIPGIRAQG